MPDPISITLAIAAAGGVAGKVAERGVDAGVEWIRTYLGKHGADVQSRAQSNQAGFLLELAARVREIEAEVEADAERTHALEQRLSDPDFAATLQSALITSARTDDADRHRLLASLVSDQLRHGEDEAFDLAAKIAVDVVPRLTRKQLTFLGLRNGVSRLRYSRRAPEPSPLVGFEQRVAELHERFHAAALVDGYDYLHLASVSCAIHGGGPIEFSLRDIVNNGSAGVNYAAHLNDFPSGRWLLELWDTGAKDIRPTLVGAVIGSSVYFSSWGR